MTQEHFVFQMSILPFQEVVVRLPSHSRQHAIIKSKSKANNLQPQTHIKPDTHEGVGGIESLPLGLHLQTAPKDEQRWVEMGLLRKSDPELQGPCPGVVCQPGPALALVAPSVHVTLAQELFKCC